MFETEVVVWLQSFASFWLTALMVVVTEAGYTRSYVALSLLVTFGIDLRLGFLLFQMVLWNGVFTEILKSAFALPRPAEVDAAVQLLGEDTLNTTPFLEADGDHFFDLPEPEAIEHFRETSEVSYGLPSGHVSTATAFWIGSATLLRSRLLAALATVIVALTALSRMYLGRHFLADVVGGFAVGIAVVLLFHHLVRAPITGSIKSPWLLTSSRAAGSTGLLGIFVTAPLLLLLLPWEIEIGSVGRIVGANLGFALLHHRGTLRQPGGWKHRLGRAALAVLLYLVVAEGIESVLGPIVVTSSAGAQFANGLIPIVVSLLGTIGVGTALGLFERSPSRKPDFGELPA